MSLIDRARNLLSPKPALPFVPEDDEVVVIDSQGVVHGPEVGKNLLGSLSKIRDRAGEY